MSDPKPDLAPRDLAFHADSGVVLSSTTEVLRFARMVITQGMAGSSFKSPEQVVIALQAGAEVGLKPMQSLKYVAVINNMPTIWGEGAKGLVLRTGDLAGWEDWWEVGGERIEQPTEFPDSLTAWCKLTRRPAITVTRSYSVADAKLAKLWAKVSKTGRPSPWVTSPARMLRVRAMSLAMRDLFADALGGLGIREEVMDIPLGPRDAEYEDVSTLAPKGAAPLEPEPEGEPEPGPAAPDDDDDPWTKPASELFES